MAAWLAIDSQSYRARYTEALLLHWVRYKDTNRELGWFFKLLDILGSDSSATSVLNRMDPNCRHIKENLNDHIDLDKDNRYYPLSMREILSQAERVLGDRAAGPYYHDPYGHKARITQQKLSRDPDIEFRKNDQYHKWEHQVPLLGWWRCGGRVITASELVEEKDAGAQKR